MDEITFHDFLKVNIQVGRIVRAEPSAKAKKPAYKLWIDFGDLGIKASSAQVTALYQLEDLIGRLVGAVTNFPPKQVADLVSEVLVLGVPVDGTEEVVLIGPDRDVPVGSRIG